MKNKFDLSVVIAGIRPQNWKAVYNSLLFSCKNYTFELIFVGPFKPPRGLIKDDTIKFIQDFGAVSRASQIGADAASGKLVFFTTDDVIFIRDAIDTVITSYYKTYSKYDIIGMRFRELDPSRINFTKPKKINLKDYPEYLAKMADDCLVNNAAPFKNEPYSPDYWFFQGIPIACQILMDLKTFKDLGGWDCSFDYLVAPAADLGMRIGNLGGNVIQSITEVSLAAYWPGESFDHKPVHDSCVEDTQLFEKTRHRNVSRTHIDFNNWEQSPEVWVKRFPEGKVYEYKQMMEKIK